MTMTTEERIEQLFADGAMVTARRSLLLAAFKAAERDALERAAQIAERRFPTDAKYHNAAVNAGLAIAEEIRIAKAKDYA